MYHKSVIEEINRINFLIGNKKIILNEGPLVRFSLEISQLFGQSVDNLVKLRQLGKVKNNQELKTKIDNLIDSLGDSIDDATKNNLKRLADDIGKANKSNFDNAVSKFKDAVDPQKLKIDLENSKTFIAKIKADIRQTVDEIAKFEDKLQSNIETTYYTKVEQQIVEENILIRTQYKTIDDYIASAKINLIKFLKEKIPGQTDEFYAFYSKFIGEKLSDFPPLKKLYKEEPINASGKKLPFVTNYKYSELLEKIENNGLENLTKEENEILDLVDKFIKSTDGNYLKIIQDINKKMKITLSDYFKKNKKIKNKFSRFVRKVLYIGKDTTKVWKIEDLNLTEELIDFIKKYDSKFYGNLENGNYKSLLNQDNQWDQLNMLDTNITDGPKYLEDLLKRKKGVTDVNDLTETEIESFLDEILNYSDETLNEELKYIKNNRNLFTEKSTVTTIKGDLGETYFLDKIAVLEKVSDSYQVVYHAGKIKGNPIDTILGIDVIMRNKQTGELFSVQIKTTNKISIKQSEVYPGENSYNVWLTSGIRLKGKNDLAAVIDDSDNFIIFGPQMQFIKNPTDGKWIENAKKFKRSGGIHYIDIDRNNLDDIITNIPF